MKYLSNASWLAALAVYSTAWAADPEILISDQMRREAVAPQCRALVVQPSEGTPEHTYQKALCLLYGLETSPQNALALALLRQSAGSGWIEAQIALGDTLQSGTNDDQLEALRWYSSAIAAGDVRATGRHARLTARINLRRQAAAAASSDNAAGAEPAAPQGYGDGMPVNPNSYHCHMTGFGKKFCHSAGD